MESQSFSSLPPEEEAQFVVFEQSTVENAKKANQIGLFLSLGILAVFLGIVAAFWAPLKPIDQAEGPSPAESKH